MFGLRRSVYIPVSIVACLITLQKSAILLEAGLEDANALRHLLSELLVEVLDKSTTIAASQEYALQVATVKTTQELGIVMTTLAAAISSSTSLQSEIVSCIFHEKTGQL